MVLNPGEYPLALVAFMGSASFRVAASVVLDVVASRDNADATRVNVDVILHDVLVEVLAGLVRNVHGAGQFVVVNRVPLDAPEALKM